MTGAPIVFLVDDLFFVAKIRGAAAALGVEATAATGPESLAAGAGAAKLLIIDLRRRDALRALELLAAEPSTAGVRSIGFVDHENAEAFEAARRHGCDTVLSKRKFSAELPALIASCRTESA